MPEDKVSAILAIQARLFCTDHGQTIPFRRNSSACVRSLPLGSLGGLLAAGGTSGFLASKNLEAVAKR